MPVSLLDLPAELRNEIYKECLVHEKSINPWNAYAKPGLVPNILLTNTTILHEACSLLYGSNCFNFIPWGSEDEAEAVSDFLDAIGPVNASRIERIRIAFPDFFNNTEEKDHTEKKVDLSTTDLHILQAIQACCTNLKSITTQYTGFGWRFPFYDLEIHEKAFALVATHFKAIKSLREVVIEYDDEDLDPVDRRNMQSHGWTLKVAEHPTDEEELLRQLGQEH